MQIGCRRTTDNNKQQQQSEFRNYRQTEISDFCLTRAYIWSIWFQDFSFRKSQKYWKVNQKVLYHIEDAFVSNQNIHSSIIDPQCVEYYYSHDEFGLLYNLKIVYSYLSFNSTSCICVFRSDVSDVGVGGYSIDNSLPGLLIRKIHGSQYKNMMRTCQNNFEMFNMMISRCR